MKHVWLISAAMALVSVSADAQIKGAGSTFAASLYGSWSQVVAKSDLKLEYEPVGSGAGVKAAQDRSADFGASDRPLTRAALEQAGLAQFPTAIGGVVLMVNITGVDSAKVKLDGETLAAIFQGRIKQWNDGAIKALNPDLSLPALGIVPVFRAEGSGTSYALTSYLSKVSAPFKSAIGSTSNLSVPGGKSAKTSSDVASLVRSTPGAIGYLDYSYAVDISLPTVQMKNQWGKFVSATHESLQLSMRAADWERMLIDQDPTFELDITDAGCPGCWPIATATYVLVPIKGRNVNSAKVLEFFENSIAQGDDSASKEGYVPLPPRAKNIVSLAMRRWFSTLERSGVSRPPKRAEDEPRESSIAVAGI